MKYRHYRPMPVFSRLPRLKKHLYYTINSPALILARPEYADGAGVFTRFPEQSLRIAQCGQ